MEYLQKKEKHRASGQFQIIAKEGFVGALLLGALFLASLKFDYGFIAGVSFIAFVAWAWAFRNPERGAWHKDRDLFYSPCDGIIQNLDKSSDTQKLIVQNRFFDNGVLRAPCDIKSAEIHTRHGLNLYFASREKKALLNKSTEFIAPNFTLKIFQEFFNFKSIFRSENLELGERMGFIKCGRIELSFKGRLRPKIEAGDKIRALGTALFNK